MCWAQFQYAVRRLKTLRSRILIHSQHLVEYILKISRAFVRRSRLSTVWGGGSLQFLTSDTNERLLKGTPQPSWELKHGGGA